jgi:hypothetical protein
MLPSAHRVRRRLSLWRCRVERAVRSHSLRAWAIGRAQMAIPSKECTLLRTILIHHRWGGGSELAQLLTAARLHVPSFEESCGDKPQPLLQQQKF